MFGYGVDRRAIGILFIIIGIVTFLFNKIAGGIVLGIGLLILVEK